MLRVKSFKISEDAAVNDLLSQYRLAPGAHILVSEGQIQVPYEDGEPDTVATHIVAIKEQKLTMLKEREIIDHSQRVLGHLMADAENRLNVATAAWNSAKSNKMLEKRMEEARNAYDQLANQRLSNQHEITRIDINCEVFDKQIAELSA